jgi:hypothetical protein
MVKNNLLSCVLILAAVAAFGINVQAATTKPVARITNVAGRVLVNQGEDYIVARPGMNLNVDDRIITMDSSEVTIFYPETTSGGKTADNGCEVRLPENSQMVVESEEDCVMGAIISSTADEGAVVGDAVPPVAAIAPGTDLGWIVPLVFAIPVICAATDCLGGGNNNEPGIIPGVTPE